MKKYLSILICTFFLLGCGEDETGPAHVHYDRDVCERCGMIISDPHYVTQIRGGPDHKVWKFDDIGDAVTWLNAKPWADDPKTEIWVMDHSNGTGWLEARSAHYVSGVMSPMAFGFGAYKTAKENTIDFKSMLEKVLKSKITINCDPRGVEHSKVSSLIKWSVNT